MDYMAIYQDPRQLSSVDRKAAYQASSFLLFIRTISQATLGYTPDIGNVAESYRQKILETADLADVDTQDWLALVSWLAAAEKFVLQCETTNFDKNISKRRICYEHE